jgi:ParG
MTKKVTFGPKPVATNVTADQWVEKRTQDGTRERLKRLTIDIPASLHSRIKAQCAVRGTKMADEIRSLLEKEFS